MADEAKPMPMVELVIPEMWLEWITKEMERRSPYAYLYRVPNAVLGDDDDALPTYFVGVRT